jgi:cytochrome c551/c552
MTTTPTMERAVLIFAQNTDAAEDLIHAINFATARPWAPLPAGANPATTKQERYSEEETDQMILHFLKRAAAAGLSTQGSVIVP